MGRVAGIVVVALVVGSLAVPGAAARTPEVGTAAGANDAVIDLLSYIPADVRGSCQIGELTAEDAGRDWVPLAPSISAYVECEPGNGEVHLSTFTKFTNLAAMNQLYDGFVGFAPETPTQSEAGQCPENTTWRFRNVPAGRILCRFGTTSGTGGQVAEYAQRIWTYDDALVLGVGQAPAAEAPALYEWWDEEAGPLQEPEEVVGLASRSPSRIAAAEKRLRSQIPRDQRAACVPVDIDDPQSTRPLFYRLRLFVQAAFDCDRVEGATSLTYASVDPRVIDGFFLGYLGFRDPPPGEDCPGDATYSVGKGKEKRTVGMYACFTENEGTPNEEAEMRWIQRKLGFYGGLSMAGASLSEVYRFWQNETGPV